MMLMVICGSRRVKAYKIRQRTEAHNSDDTRVREKKRQGGRRREREKARKRGTGDRQWAAESDWDWASRHTQR